MTGDYFRLRVLELAPQVFVAGQVFEQELKVAAEQGIRSVINNRPDGESANQPPSAHLAGVAEGLERPMLVFCRSGARSTALWEMCEAAGMQFDDK